MNINYLIQMTNFAESVCSGVLGIKSMLFSFRPIHDISYRRRLKS